MAAGTTSPVAILRDASQSKSAVADFDPSLTAEVGQARLRCDAPQDEVSYFTRSSRELAIEIGPLRLSNLVNRFQGA
jgi:hypothetical protein